MIIGLDFGTTNTSAAVLDGGRVGLLPIDQASTNPEICRSAIYITRAGEYSLGSSAINQYFAQNIGRPTRYRKVRVGEIIQIFAELPVFYRDVFIYEDEYSPGRLFTSIKTALRSREYHGTVFRNNWYTASDLVATFLGGVRMQIERELNSPASAIVLGRPVHFSTDLAEDQIAQGRLLEAAFKAGFQKVYLEYEPVAAALSYAQGLKESETILVFDFGGGTLDFTIMEVGHGRTNVLATGGVPIAGDIFDQRLFRVTVPKHLGEGDEFFSGKSRLPIPAHIFDTLAQPHEILSLNTPQNLEMLRKIDAGAYHKEKTHALLKVVSSNYALMMFDYIERAKRQLSSQLESDLRIETADFTIYEKIKRTVFERAIAREYEMIRAETLDTIERSGIKVAAIDRVIRTGGSSQIPIFVNMLNEIFGAEKVQAIDIFTSVTAGLAIRGQQISAGMVNPTAFTRESAGLFQETTTHPAKGAGARPVDLDDVLKQIQIRQEAVSEPASLPEDLLFLLNDRGLYCQTIGSLPDRAGNAAALPWSAEDLTPGCQILPMKAGERVLLATNQMKLISAQAQELYLAQQTARDGIEKVLPLEVDEQVSAIARWNSGETNGEYICMVTSVGQGRAFSAEALSDTIAHRPYYQLERRYHGAPIALLRAASTGLIAVGTTLGRAGAAPISALVVQAFDIVRARPGEMISSAASTQPGGKLRAIAGNGAWLEFDPQDLLTDKPPAQRGQFLLRNHAIIGFLPADSAPGKRYYIVSNYGRLFLTHTAAEQSRRLTRLEPEETLVGGVVLDDGR